MGKELRTCAVCHEKYSFCPVCSEKDRLKETWYFVYCSANCHEIGKITTDFEDGVSGMTPDQAKEMLDKLDLSKLTQFGQSYQKTIARIQNESTKIVLKQSNDDIIVDNGSPAIAENIEEKKELGKKYTKISKKSSVVKNVDGDLEK